MNNRITSTQANRLIAFKDRLDATTEEIDTGDMREAIAAGSTAWTAAANASLRAISDGAKGGVK